MKRLYLCFNLFYSIILRRESHSLLSTGLGLELITYCLKYLNWLTTLTPERLGPDPGDRFPGWLVDKGNSLLLASMARCYVAYRSSCPLHRECQNWRGWPWRNTLVRRGLPKTYNKWMIEPDMASKNFEIEPYSNRHAPRLYYNQLLGLDDNDIH